VTVVLIEHDMGLVSGLSDRVMAMSSGRILALGPSAAVQSDPAVEAAYLGG
jgi:branched-chain amino acid transport system ATP-binding protein